MPRFVGRLLLTATLLLPVAATPEELKLATWNIAWLTLRPAGDPALPRDVVPRDPQAFALLASYARRLAADVVAVQEVDGVAAAARVFDPDDYTLHLAEEADVQRTGFAVRRGLAVRRHPDLEALDLRPRARLSLRRGVDITVEAAGGPIRLLSVHLVAGCREGAGPRPDTGPQCDDLGQQAALLADWVAARRRAGEAFALLGDFNRRLTERDPMLAQLAGDGPLLRTTAGVSDPCWGEPGRGGRPFIDHILLGGGAERRLVPGSLRVLVYAERGAEWRDRLSDHCPVSVRLRP